MNQNSQAPALNPTPVPIFRSVAAGYAFLISHWHRAMLAAAPYTVAYIAQLLLLRLVGQGQSSAGLEMLILVLSVVTVIASLALSASMLRMAVLGDYSGKFGLKVGRDEWRLFLVSILVLALTVLVFIMVFMFWAVFFSMIATGALERAGIDPETSGLDLIEAMAYMNTADWGAVVVTGSLGVFVMAWLSARLILSFPATIDKGRVLVLSVWPLTNGMAWRIALALLLASIPLIAVEIALYEVLSFLIGERFLADAALLSSEVVEEAGVQRVREYERWLGVMAAINIPLFSGIYAYIYRQRTASPAGQG